MQRIHITLFITILTSLISTLLGACSGAGSMQAAEPFPMASTDQMPEEVRSAPATVLQAYQFAAANPDVLKRIPCYCGCGSVGHASNYACYVADVEADGKVTYDAHALGCSICVDITQDTMRLLREGQGTAEIKANIDQTYSQYGPSNIP